MKLSLLLAALSFVPFSLSLAQTPSATRPASATATTARTTAVRSTTAGRQASSAATTSVTTTAAATATRSATAAAPTASATRPTTATAPTTTSTASTSATNPYRQQELYDQYHGITKKPAPANAPPAAGTTTRTASTRRTEPSVSTSESAETVSRRESAAPVASDAGSSGVRIGLRGGVTYPYNFDSDVTGDPAVSFVGGVVFNFGSGALSFQPEINYARYAGRATAFGSTLTAAADQLEVPLFLKIASGDANSTRFFLNVGPYASYALNVSINGKTQSLEGTEGRLGFGAAAGIGTALKTGPGHLTIELRGLYPLGNTADGFNTDSRTILSQATLGYVFPLGGR